MKRIYASVCLYLVPDRQDPTSPEVETQNLAPTLREKSIPLERLLIVFRGPYLHTVAVSYQLLTRALTRS